MIIDDLSLKIPSYKQKNNKQLYSPFKELKEHKEEEEEEERIDFILYTMDLSYFSGKLEVYLNYKEYKYKRYEPSAKEFDQILFQNTGSEQLPQLYDNRKNIKINKRWLRDTTSIIEYLENDQNLQINNFKSILVNDEFQNFFLFLFEDYADEFLWRPAMFWRWEPNFDRFIMGFRFFYEFLYSIQPRYALTPSFIRPFTASFRQWLVSSFGEDCTTKEKRDVVIHQYLDLLDLLENILSNQPYLFGNHPTLIDIGFAGPFFKHFSSDFTPRKVMQQRAPAVYEWIARLWNCKASKLTIESGFPIKGTLPQNWNSLLSLLTDYLEYYSLNRIAHNKGEKFFQWNHKNQLFTVPTVPYRSWCLMKLQQRYEALSDENKLKVKEILNQYSCWNYFITGYGEIIPPECDIEPPFAVYPPPTTRTRLAEKWDYDSVYLRYLWITCKKWLFRGLLLGGIGIFLKYKKFTIYNK